MSFDLDHAVVGIRQWVITNCGRYVLSPLYDPETRPSWHPGVNRSQCWSYFLVPSSPGGLEHAPCDMGCGLYAYHDDQQLFATLVTGIVRGWGHIRVHPDGWRAEYAEILALVKRPAGVYPIHTDDLTHGPAWPQQLDQPVSIIHEIAEHYRVPLIPQDKLMSLLPEFGSPVPVSKRPEPIERILQSGVITLPPLNGYSKINMTFTIDLPTEKADD